MTWFFTASSYEILSSLLWRKNAFQLRNSLKGALPSKILFSAQEENRAESCSINGGHSIAPKTLSANAASASP